MDASTRILVVDDNETNRQLLIDVLSVLDCEVFVAEDGQQALDCVAEHSPSLVLMDIAMPVMDGLEATRRIRQMPEHHTLPIIIITAYQEDDFSEEARASGCDEFMTKPIDIPLLLAHIERLLP